MGASQVVINDLIMKLSFTKDPKVVDELLDKLYECKNLATDWDAEQWGFNPRSWMLKERLELDQKSKSLSGPGV